MNSNSILILMGILVLLIGCTCLGNPSVRGFQEGMSEGDYTKAVGLRAAQQSQQPHGLNPYNHGDYMGEDMAHASHRPFTHTRREDHGASNDMDSQRSYERQQMQQANQKMDQATQGIPRSQIPSGDEDQYILKSEIVPPVCPACPAITECPRQKKCEPCPPCGRCPEPAFECKKVPNYKSASPSFLPRPILSDFSQFGL